MSAVHLKVLRDARAQIESESEDFVCLAIKYHHGLAREGEAHAAAMELAIWARSLLGGCYTLESWLEEHHGIGGLHGSLREYGVREKLRTTRLAWIDWMIEYWRAR